MANSTQCPGWEARHLALCLECCAADIAHKKAHARCLQCHPLPWHTAPAPAPAPKPPPPHAAAGRTARTTCMGRAAQASRRGCGAAADSGRTTPLQSHQLGQTFCLTTVHRHCCSYDAMAMQASPALPASLGGHLAVGPLLLQAGVKAAQRVVLRQTAAMGPDDGLQAVCMEAEMAPLLHM